MAFRTDSHGDRTGATTRHAFTTSGRRDILRHEMADHDSSYTAHPRHSHTADPDALVLAWMRQHPPGGGQRGKRWQKMVGRLETV